jgi:hypothetical protein
MAEAESQPNRNCPECGASLLRGAVQCWLCHREVVQEARSQPPAPTGSPYQYTLSSLLLLMTLAAILLSLGSMEPGVGIAAAILAAPALLRTICTSAIRGSGGQPLSVGGKVAIFMLTLGMVVIVIVAAAAAFFATCLTTASLGKGDSLVPLGIFLGLVAVVVATVLLVWLFIKLSRKIRIR